MSSPFETALRRAHAIQRRKDDPHTQMVGEEFIKLLNEISDKLKEDPETVCRLGEITSRQICICEDESYQQGFRDCFYLLKWMDAFSLN
ncbi:hypothetical protein [Candidatus Soleaferrea massiliensis]|uniref:hypothetical protein n=1 Tax=Candidatus Soleaferrea massiliensis TaxID=1470354 RepID=UPI00058DCDA5|nr:hypothetical protein [Candidatus Soleaferrea massiliensis]